MDKLVIIHFLPLENYPPVMNLTRVLAAQNTRNIPITVITTESDRNKKIFSAAGTKILRIARWIPDMTSINRYWLYLTFNISSILYLIRLKPTRVLYYETLSSFPAVVYKNFFSGKSEIFIHYHEYTSKDEYKAGMLLSRVFHNLEKSVYKKAKWISHTNRERAELFKKDVGLSPATEVNELPNYPPLSWTSTSKPSHESRKGKFVYVGAISLDTMYVKEWATLISRHPDEFSWDIYSDNYSIEVLNYLDKLNASNITFKGSVEYDSLPEVLAGYDAGLILYKGHIQNYIYNAPNKLFEYYACGLDTLFPVIMKGCYPYVTHGTYPKVTALDFEKLDMDAVNSALNRDGLQYQPSSFYYEKNLPRLTDQLLAHA